MVSRPARPADEPGAAERVSAAADTPYEDGGSQRIPGDLRPISPKNRWTEGKPRVWAHSPDQRIGSSIGAH